MGFGLGGGLGIKETRKHVEGTLINPETSMEGISSKNGVDQRTIDRVFPHIDDPWGELPDYQDYQAVLGRTQVKPLDELKAEDKKIMENAQKQEHSLFGLKGVGPWFTSLSGKVIGSGHGETKSASETINITKKALNENGELKAFDYVGDDNIIHLFVNNNGTVRHYQASNNHSEESPKYKLVNEMSMTDDELKSRIGVLVDSNEYIQSYTVYTDKID